MNDNKIHWWELNKTIQEFNYDASHPDYFFSVPDKTVVLDGNPSASFYDKSAEQAFFLSHNGSFWYVSLQEVAAVKLKSSHTPHFEMSKAIDFKYVEPKEAYGVK